LATEFLSFIAYIKDLIFGFGSKGFGSGIC